MYGFGLKPIFQYEERQAFRVGEGTFGSNAKCEVSTEAGRQPEESQTAVSTIWTFLMKRVGLKMTGKNNNKKNPRRHAREPKRC